MKYTNCAVLTEWGRSQSADRKTNQGFPEMVVSEHKNKQGKVQEAESSLRFFLEYRVSEKLLSASGCWAFIIYTIWPLIWLWDSISRDSFSEFKSNEPFFPQGPLFLLPSPSSFLSLFLLSLLSVILSFSASLPPFPSLFVFICITVTWLSYLYFLLLLVLLLLLC